MDYDQDQPLTQGTRRTRRDGVHVSLRIHKHGLANDRACLAGADECIKEKSGSLHTTVR